MELVAAHCRYSSTHGGKVGAQALAHGIMSAFQRGIELSSRHSIRVASILQLRY